MGAYLALTRKETAGILLNPSILFVTAFFVLLDSFAFYLLVAKSAAAYAVFDDMALFMLFTSTLLYPLASMRSFSEETADGTLEPLFTAPISIFAVVMAKFTAALVYVALTLLPGLVYALLLSYAGNLDWQATAAAFLSLFMTGALAMALGMFISALTISPPAAAAGSAGVLTFMILASDVDPHTGFTANLVNSVSHLPHAKRWIAGELDTRGLVYFLSAIALFLFLAWLSAGSRNASRKGHNPVARRRMLVTHALVSLGLLLLLLQVAILHVKGIWESGLPMGRELSALPWRWLIPLFLSLGCLLWSILTYRAARRAARRGERHATRYATISESTVAKASNSYSAAVSQSSRRIALAVLAALIITVNLNWLAHYPFRTFANDRRFGFLAALQARSWDVSEEGRNSLSGATRRTLDSLQGRVNVYSFFPADKTYQGVPLAEEMRRLLGRFADYNGMVNPSFADASNEPDRAKAFAEELGVPLAGMEDRLIIDYQGRRLDIPAGNLVAPPTWQAQMAGETRWSFDGERGVTQGVMRLLDPRVPNVYFAWGHLELSLIPTPQPERSVSLLAQELARNNMRVQQLSMGANAGIPPECDILVIAAPRVPWLTHEAEAVNRYLEAGGRLLFFAPVADPDYPAGEGADPLADLLFGAGGTFRQDVMQDAVKNDNGQTLLPLGRMRSAGDAGVDFVFPRTRTIRDNPMAVRDGWICERLLSSYPSAVAMELSDGKQRPGPFTLGYRSSKETSGREARVVMLASGRMASDADIGRGANSGLVVGLMQWLAGREETYEIAPRVWIDRRIRLVGPELRAILWIGVVGLPLCWILAGLAAWWTRRE